MKVRSIPFLLMLVQIGVNAQTLVTPKFVETKPQNRFGINSFSVAAHCLDGSGLFPQLPPGATDADASNITHLNCADNTTSTSAYLSDNSGIDEDWKFTFDYPEDIKGMVLWTPRSAHYGGGDAPFKRFRIHGQGCGGRFVEEFDLEDYGGPPNGSARIIYFSSTHYNISDLTLEILETYEDLSSDCNIENWAVASAVGSDYNVELGEARFIRDDNPASIVTVDLLASNEALCGGCAPLSFSAVNKSNGETSGPFLIEECPETISLCLEGEASFDLVGSNGVIFPDAITNGTVNYPSGQSEFQFGGASNFDGTVITATSSSINHDEIWEGKYLIEDNVIITINGAQLDLTNVDLIFGKCAGMEFVNGGYVRANNSVFRPCKIDATWKGLRFDGAGEYDSIINESTFKGAEIAVNLENSSDGVVSDNLFSNCNQGVKVRNNDGFRRPISGNRFVFDESYPEFGNCYPSTSTASAYGVFSESARLQKVSQNEFLHSARANSPHVYAIHQYAGGGQISENKFTDIASPIGVVRAQHPTFIEDNEIEVNRPVGSTVGIAVSDTLDGVIEIRNNEIICNRRNASDVGISAKGSAKLNIFGNDIRGAMHGIRVLDSTGVQLSRNMIIDAQKNGIYFTNNGQTQNFIACNDITMSSLADTHGIHVLNSDGRTKITSNCIKDSSTSLRIEGSASLPYIRNNFLYNYSSYGIRNSGQSGSIGTIDDPGMNTCWSNDNSAVDIQSSTSIQAADNFGVFNVSFATVQIISANPYHSTASCASQIFNLPSQGKLNSGLVCDSFDKILLPAARSPQ